jgi:hypothetical protein
MANDAELAHHEAGHAVMSIILNSTMDFVTIDKAGNLEGLMDPGENFRTLEQKMSHLNLFVDEIYTMLDYIRVIYAGPMAHGIFLNELEWWN